jgi:hypothetical protein
MVVKIITDENTSAIWYGFDMKFQIRLIFLVIFLCNGLKVAQAEPHGPIRCENLFETPSLLVSLANGIPQAILDRFEYKIFVPQEWEGTENVLPANRALKSAAKSESPIVVAQVPQSSVTRIRLQNGRGEEVNIDQTEIPYGIGLIAPYVSGMKVLIALRNGESVVLKLRNFFEIWHPGVSKAAAAFYLSRLSRFLGTFPGGATNFSASALSAFRASDLREIEFGLPDGTVLAIPIKPGKPAPALPAFVLDEIKSITYDTGDLKFTYEIHNSR